MVVYFAEIAGVRAAVDPNDSVEVGLVVDRQPVEGSPTGEREAGPTDALVRWIGRRTWREVARDFEGHRLVTWSQSLAAVGKYGRFPEIVALRCELDDSLEQLEPLTLTSDETRLILATLADTGKRELAARLAPVLERCTRTDPPPAAMARANRATPTEPRKARKP